MKLTNLEVFSLVFYATMAIIIVAANATVILSMILIKNLRTTSNCFIVSLSLADLFIGLITLPVRAMEILRLDFTVSIEYCRVAHVFTVFNFTASVSNLVVIAVDRYIAIMYPYFYVRLRHYTKHYVCIMLFLAWIPAIVLTFVPLYAWGSNGMHGHRTGNLGICKFTETLSKEFILTILATVLATSILVIVPLYIRIFIVARSQIRKVKPFVEDPASLQSEPTNQPLHHQQRGSYDVSSFESTSYFENNNKHVKLHELRRKRKTFLQTWKTTKTMVLIVVIFLICWLTFVVSTLMFIICENCADERVVMAGKLIIYAGSAANPFVYYLRFKIFRREIKKLWRNLDICCF